jgi:hypothetical protein
VDVSDGAAWEGTTATEAMRDGAGPGAPQAPMTTPNTAIAATAPRPTVISLPLEPSNLKTVARRRMLWLAELARHLMDIAQLLDALKNLGQLRD